MFENVKFVGNKCFTYISNINFIETIQINILNLPLCLNPRNGICGSFYQCNAFPKEIAEGAV
jgi:hypothetical protein